MKPALVIISATNGTIDREKYMKQCMGYVVSSGYFPMTREVYDSYVNMDPDKFTQLMLDICKEVYFFTDFGISREMERTEENAREKNIPVCHVKVIKNTPERLYKTPGSILEEVSEKTGIPIDELKARTRKREIVDARFIYFRRTSEILKATSLERIGREVNRGHCDVIHGIREAKETRELIMKYNLYYGTE